MSATNTNAASFSGEAAKIYNLGREAGTVRLRKECADVAKFATWVRDDPDVPADVKVGLLDALIAKISMLGDGEEIPEDMNA